MISFIYDNNKYFFGHHGAAVQNLPISATVFDSYLEVEIFYFLPLVR